MRPFLAVLLAAACLATSAAAWTRPGHMVTAAIAYDEIARQRPDLLPALEKLLDAHADRGPFQVAIDRTTGAERARRMFLEAARWPDDVRQTPHDHPTWHAALWPVVAPDAPAEIRARLARRSEQPSGEALEALALNRALLADPRASAAARAEALCWVLHVLGDIHQPLHTAERFSAAWPDGDGGGGKPLVRDPLSDEAIALHWLWDDSISRSGVAADADQRAREIAARYPRTALPELKAGSADFAAWAKRESYPLAVSFAYGAEPPTSADPASAPAVPEAYWRDLRGHAERRVALAGYRMAEVVIAALDDAAR
jgi:hypothetical protein